MRKSLPWLMTVWLLMAATLSVRAEKYLSQVEVQKLCFPAADRFEARIIQLTPDQVKTIEAQTHIKVESASVKVWTAYAGEELEGFLFADQVFGKHEWIDYAVALNPAGAVQQIEITEYRESHGREVRGKKWRGQFKGKTTAAPLKIHDDIYNISGATISCRSVTAGVKRIVATYELVARPLLVRTNGLPAPRAS